MASISSKAEHLLVVVCVITVWSCRSHLLSLSVSSALQQGRMLTLLCTGPQDFVLKTGKQFKEALLDDSGAISAVSKQDFKSFDPSAVVKVRNISEFQRSSLLLFGFLLGSFSGLGCSVPQWIWIILSYSARLHQRQAPAEGREIRECSWCVI